MAYRITTVSSLDGKPTTKKFASEAAAKEVWHSIKRNAGNYYYGALYELRGKTYNEYSMTLDRIGEAGDR